jgi:hypothetical protein
MMVIRRLRELRSEHRLCLGQAWATDPGPVLETTTTTTARSIDVRPSLSTIHDYHHIHSTLIKIHFRSRKEVPTISYVTTT